MPELIKKHLTVVQHFPRCGSKTETLRPGNSFTCKLFFLAICWLCAGACELGAQPAVQNTSTRSWSQFRGDHRDGSVKGLPRQALHLKLLWEFPLPASGLGGVAATEELVVVSGRNINDTADLYFILDPEDGGIIVKHEVPTQGRLDYGNSPRATPVIGSELVYVLSAFGHLLAIDPTEGQVRWRKHLVDDFGGRLPTWGYCASPLLHDDRLIVEPGGLNSHVVALDAHNGELKWKSPGTNRCAYASPVLWPPRRSAPSLVLGCDQAGLVARSLSNGDVAWRLDPQESGEFMVPSPVVVGEQLFWIGETNGLRSYRFDENQTTRKPIATAHHAEILSETHSPSILAGAVVAIDDQNDLVALDWKNELRLVDRFAHPALSGYAAMMTEDDRALICCANGTLLLMKLESGKWLKLDEKQPLPQTGNILAHPAFVDGKLYVRYDRSLRCYSMNQ